MMHGEEDCDMWDTECYYDGAYDSINKEGWELVTRAFWEQWLLVSRDEISFCLYSEMALPGSI